MCSKVRRESGIRLSLYRLLRWPFVDNPKSVVDGPFVKFRRRALLHCAFLLRGFFSEISIIRALLPDGRRAGAYGSGAISSPMDMSAREYSNARPHWRQETDVTLF